MTLSVIDAPLQPPAIPPADAPQRRTPAPLLLPTIGFLLGDLAAYLAFPLELPQRAALMLAPFAAGLMIAFTGRRLKWPARGFVAGGVLVGFALGAARLDLALTLPARHVAHAATDVPTLTRLCVRVVSTPSIRPAERNNPYSPMEGSDRTSFTAEAVELRSTPQTEPLTGLLRVTVLGRAPAIAAGDELELTGWLARPRGPFNPGEIDWRRWNRLQQIHASLRIDALEHVRSIASTTGFGTRLTRRLRDMVTRAMLGDTQPTDETDRLLETMVLGQRSATTRQVNEAFARTGAIHLLSVSGFHVAILAGGAWWLARRACGARRRAAALLAGLVLLLYAMLVEWNAPIARATIMGLLVCAAQLSGRPLSTLNWLAMSALAILLLEPLELFRPGFQLSFTQMLTLVCVVPWLLRRPPADDAEPVRRDRHTYREVWIGWIRSQVLSLLIVSVCAWAASLPLVAAHFGRFGPWAAMQSALVTPIATAVIWLGFLTVLAGALPWIGPTLAAPLQYATHASGDGLLGMVELLARMPGTQAEIAAPGPLWTLGAGVVVTTAMMSALGWRRARDAAARRVAGGAFIASAASAFVLALVAWRGPTGAPGGGLRVAVFAVGNGASTLLQSGTRTALVDAGTIQNTDIGRLVAGALPWLGARRIDLLCVSHADFDHFSGVEGLLSRGLVDRLGTGPLFANDEPAAQLLAGWVALLPGGRSGLQVLRAGDSLPLGNARVECLWPPAELAAPLPENDTSLVLRVTAAGRSILIAGDIEQAGLLGLLESHDWGRIELASDVLVAPHHGDTEAATARFLAAVGPKVIVVSSAQPRPRFERVVRATLGPECRLLVTGRAGMVEVRFEPNGTARIDTPYGLR